MLCYVMSCYVMSCYVLEKAWAASHSKRYERKTPTQGQTPTWLTKMVGQKLANVFCQAIWPTCFQSTLVPSFPSEANRGWKDCNIQCFTSFYRSCSPTRAGRRIRKLPHSKQVPASLPTRTHPGRITRWQTLPPRIRPWL